MKITNYEKNSIYSEEAFRLHEEFCEKIAFLEIPNDLLIMAIPPFAGVVIRYLFTDKLTKKGRVSVYFDCEDKLGCMKKPYYEIYLVGAKKQPKRFLVGEEKKMIKAIQRLLKTEQKKRG